MSFVIAKNKLKQYIPEGCHLGNDREQPDAAGDA